MNKLGILAATVAATALSACAPEVSYEPEVASVTQNGLIYYATNCESGNLAGCNAKSAAVCQEMGRRIKVTNHFVVGSEVSRVTFRCTTGRQQLVPENITFDDGTVVR